MDDGEAVTVPESIETAHEVVVLQEESCVVIKKSSITIEGEDNIGVSKEVVNHVTTVVEKKKDDKPAIDVVEKLVETCEKVEEEDGPDGSIVAKGEDAKRVPNSNTTDVEGKRNDKTLTDMVDKLEGYSKEVEGVNGKNTNVDSTEKETKVDNSVDEVEDLDGDEIEDLDGDEVEDLDGDEVEDLDGDEVENMDGGEVEEYEEVEEESKHEENATKIKDKGETLSGDANKEDVNVSSGKKVDEKNIIQVEKDKETVVAASRKMEEKVEGNCRNKKVNKGAKTGNKPTPKANPKTPESGKKRKVSGKPSSKSEDKQESSPLKRTASEKVVKAGFDAGPSSKENESEKKGDTKDGLDSSVKNMVTKNELGSSLRKKGKKKMDKAQVGTGLSVNKNVSEGKEKPEDTPGSSQKKNISKGKFVVDEKGGSSSKKKGSMRRKDSMGMIFMCSSKTKKDCYRYKVLGLPAAKKDMVQKIYKGMRLFLFDFDLRVMYGIYKAAGPGGFNIEPKAFKSAFPSQVRFEIQYDCVPLGEEKFKKVIKDNYYSKNKFNGQLNSEQVKNLCKLFQATSRKSKSELARDIEPERNRVRGDQDRRIRSQRPAEERRQPAVRLNHQHGYDERSAVYDEREMYMLAPVARYPPPPLHRQSPSLLAPSSLDMDMYRRDRMIEDRGGYRRSDLEEIDRRESYLPYNREVGFPPIYHHHALPHYPVVNEPRQWSPPTYEAEYRSGGGGRYGGGSGYGGGGAAAAVPSNEYHHRPSEYRHHRRVYRL